MLRTQQIARSSEGAKELLPTLPVARTNWRLRNWSCLKRPRMWAKRSRWCSELVSIHERESLGENRQILAVRDSRSKNWARKIAISRQSADVATSSTATRPLFPQHARGV